MNTPAELGTASRERGLEIRRGQHWSAGADTRVSGRPEPRRQLVNRLASYRVWAVGVMVAVAGSAGLAEAQDSATGLPAANAPASTVPPELAGVAGVKPGMSNGELIDTALEATRAQRLFDARRLLEVVVRRDRQNIRALRLLGYVYELLANAASANLAEDEAKSFLGLAIRQYLEAAPLAMDAGDLQAAEQMYKAVLLHDPVSPEAQVGLARVLGASDRQLQARERYESYLKTVAGRQDSRARLELGRIYRGLRYLNQAVSTLEKAKELNPEDPEILVELAGTYQDSGYHEKALKLVESATNKAPRNPAYHNIHAVILLAQSRPETRVPGNPEDARRNLEKAGVQARQAVDLAFNALSENRHDSELLASLGRYYATYAEVLGVKLAEVRTARSALSPDDVERRIELAKAELDLRMELAAAIQKEADVAQTLRLHAALEVLLKADEQGEKNARFLEVLARLQFNVYQRDDAADTCRRLLKLEPQNPVAAQLLKRLGIAIPGESRGPGE